MIYRDSRGDDWLISDMKTAKLSNVYKSTKAKRRNLEKTRVLGEFKTVAHERQYNNLKALEYNLKQELMKRNPYGLEDLLHGN
ncbi:hypothetical protein VPEG_00067 [Vibrio phage SIO-2]|uniref:hypothetical protein n=1 Tax=Vibrio phage SIO-2 TaxID=700512 RepID=UPI0002357C69|nr:hypothetical protein VPEG_00067 [Vibrio phage SIO-2]AET42218.1 hypothetical protein VPEG_00067 [Vibrio phage SIO-2]